MKPQCCKNCLFSRWPLTPTGRISCNSAGKCAVVIPEQVLPFCITNAYGYRDNFHRTSIGTKDGETCPMYEENPGNPIKEGTP